MRLVVIDTNVVISAGLNRAGAPGKLIDLVLDGQIQTLVSPVIISEYRSISRRPKFADYDFPPQWLELLISTRLELPDQSRWPHRLPDLDDLPFLALARTAGAWLVTGNLKHYPASARAGVTVISPADYLGHLTETNSQSGKL